VLVNFKTQNISQANITAKPAHYLHTKFDLFVFSVSFITTMTPNLKQEFSAGTILLAYIPQKLSQGHQTIV
jgi:hypothetical protein